MGARGPAPNPRGLLKPRVHVKCTEAWADWVREMAEGEGISVAELLDTALKAFAKQANYPPSPPRT